MDIEVKVENHEQRILALERDMIVIKEIQSEIRSIGETLIALANELKHTNQHLARHERRIDELDIAPKQRVQQIFTAVLSALAGGLISSVIGNFIK